MRWTEGEVWEWGSWSKTSSEQTSNIHLACRSWYIYIYILLLNKQEDSRKEKLFLHFIPWYTDNHHLVKAVTKFHAIRNGTARTTDDNKGTFLATLMDLYLWIVFLLYQLCITSALHIFKYLFKDFYIYIKKKRHLIYVCIKKWKYELIRIP